MAEVKAQKNRYGIERVFSLHGGFTGRRAKHLQITLFPGERLGVRRAFNSQEQLLIYVAPKLVDPLGHYATSPVFGVTRIGPLTR